MAATTTTAVTTIRVLEQLRVSPPPGSLPDSSLPLSFFDVIWIFMDPVHRLFLYPFPHSTAHFVDSSLPNLKSSLSLALRIFYPLAGNFIRFDSGFELRYADGDSVSLTVAEYDGTDPSNSFEKLCGGDPFDFPKFHQLIPSLPAPPENEIPIPLLALQVTVFPNHGISLGVSVHHAACDGSSSVHFLKYLASACKKSTPSPPLPVIDRTLIADPDGLYSIFLDYVKEFYAGREKANGGGPDEVLATFTLGCDQIRRMKEFIKARAKSLPHCSTFMLACAYTWVGVVRTRRDLERDRTVAFAFSVDCRSRLSPPIPASYFGNCLTACFAEANVGDLVGEDGLIAASEAIGRAIGELKDGVFNSTWLEKTGPANPGDLFTIAGSPKFGVYEIDFGWGRPRKVVVPSIQNSRAMSLADSVEGGGGVEIGLVLQRDDMDDFKTYFSNVLLSFNN